MQGNSKKNIQTLVIRVIICTCSKGFCMHRYEKIVRFFKVIKKVIEFIVKQVVIYLIRILGYWEGNDKWGK